MLKQSLELEKQRWLSEQQAEQAHWKRRFEAAESARMRALEDEWARREEERSSLLRSAQGEYERLEKALRASLLDLEARERRLAVAENALQREQQTQREENELVRKRLQSEQTHALSIAHKQSEALEKRVTVLERQLSDAEKRARLVEADFAEYRLQQRKVPEPRLREEISALKGSLLELEKQKMEQTRLRETAEANASVLTLQLEKMARLVQREKKKNEVRVVEELEKMRVKYVAREEKYVLDGDREELRAIKRQLDELRGLDFRLANGDAGASIASRVRHCRSSPSKAQTQVGVSYSHERGHGLRTTATHRLVKLKPQRSSNSVQPLQFQRSDTVSRLSGRQTAWQPSQRHHVRRSLNDATGPVGNANDSDSDNDDDDFSSRRSEDGVSEHGSSLYYDHDSDHDEQTSEPHDSDVDGARASRAFYDDAHQSENDDLNATTAHVELERLERERKLLLASGAYSEHSNLVCELTRLIEETRSRAKGL